jgi:DNA-binding transcriptional MocR family regulator
MRLNYSNSSEEMIEEGINRLGKLIKKTLIQEKESSAIGQTY